jgi:hypothetical protein
MKTLRIILVICLGGVLQVMPLKVTAQDTNPAVVIEWNQLALATVPASAGPLVARYYTLVHIAMFDAANSIERRYTPFLTDVPASSGASPEAAVAQAAHDVLVALVPGNPPKAVLDAALSAKLATLPPGRARQGVAIGQAAAQRVLAARANDGIIAAGPAYVLPTIPGLWQPAPGAAALTQLPSAKPFMTESVTQFLAPRFPELNSARYATDFNEVKLIGKSDSATRTPTQTQTAKLWATLEITNTNLFRIWNNVARDVTLAQHLSLLDAARLYALMNASMMDSLLNSQTGKFTYGLWRPVTAIQRAGEDMNDATAADPTWAPLVPTPPYPTYPGNMAGLGACASKALQLVLGTDNIAFTATWNGINGNPNVTRPYSSFSQLAQEEADSRIYAGIHFRFDNEASQAACARLVTFALGKVMVPN